MKKIIAYKNHFEKFLKDLSELERKKTLRGLALLASDDKVPLHYIKYLREDIYELRITCGNNELRLLYIYDGNTLVVLFNCFRKKTQKTPKNEIDKAIKLKEEYYGTKRNK